MQPRKVEVEVPAEKSSGSDSDMESANSEERKLIEEEFLLDDIHRIIRGDKERVVEEEQPAKINEEESRKAASEVPKGTPSLFAV